MTKCEKQFVTPEFCFPKLLDRHHRAYFMQETLSMHPLDTKMLSYHSDMIPKHGSKILVQRLRITLKNMI